MTHQILTADGASQLLARLLTACAVQGSQPKPPEPDWMSFVDLVQACSSQAASTVHDTTNGTTALHLASRFGKKAYVELLLARGCQATKATAYGSTALQCALYGDDGSDACYDTIRTLLDASGKTVEMSESCRWVSFYGVGTKAYERTTSLLVERGAILL